MTTRRSSSRRASPIRAASLSDAAGRPVPLGAVIGKGGEGSVYEVQGQPRLAAKLYHKLPLSEEQVAKLSAMAACWTKELEAISAWPRSLLFDGGPSRPCGILLPKIVDGRHLHELYGTTNRRRHFPEALWHHLVLAARNAAAAFHTLHAAGIVVGDVNQGNLFVDPQMCVRLIDCDSFQIAHDGQTFLCPVGTPHFTPPELQGKKLRENPRTLNHDAFGLAVMIFHLLFVGRHPFAGRFRGLGDLPITKAIAERRFAFSRDRAATQVEPPPASLRLEDLPPAVGDLFERAFRSEGPRPTPQQWAVALEALMKERKACSFDRLHVYYSGLDECPWCRIEDEGGPAFFVPADGMSSVSIDRLAHLDRKIDDLRPARFPDLSPKRLELPKMPPLKRLATTSKRTKVDAAAFAMAGAAALCLAGVAFPLALAAGAAVALVSACLLLRLSESKQRRQRVADALAQLAQLQQQLAKIAPRIAQVHDQRERAFKRSAGELKTAIAHYRAEGHELHDVLIQQSEIQKNEFLRGHLIRDHIREIPGLSSAIVSMLESFGVESALDVHDLNLCSIPNIDSYLTLELVQWRSLVESEFVFRPDHGITAAELARTAQSAVRRFKLAQARKVLMGTKQVETLAKAAQMELSRSLARFDALANQYRDLAQQLRDFQSGRPAIERTINRSPATIAAWAAGIPLVGGLLYLLFG